MKRLFSVLLILLLLPVMMTALGETTLTEITFHSETSPSVADGIKLLIRQNSGGLAAMLVSGGAESLLAGAEQDDSGRLVIGSDLLPGCIALPSVKGNPQSIEFKTTNLTGAGLNNRISISHGEKGVTYYTIELNRDTVLKLLPAAAADLKAAQGLRSALGMTDTAFAAMIDAIAARLQACAECDGFVTVTLSILEHNKAFYGLEATCTTEVNGEACRNYARFLTKDDGTVSIRYVRRSKHINEGWGMDCSGTQLSVYTLGWSNRADDPDSGSIVFTAGPKGLASDADGSFSASLIINGKAALTVNGQRSVISDGNGQLFAHGEATALTDLLSNERLLQSWLDSLSDTAGRASVLLKLLFPAD